MLNQSLVTGVLRQVDNKFNTISKCRLDGDTTSKRYTKAIDSLKSLKEQCVELGVLDEYIRIEKEAVKNQQLQGQQSMDDFLPDIEEYYENYYANISEEDFIKPEKPMVNIVLQKRPPKVTKVCSTIGLDPDATYNFNKALQFTGKSANVLMNDFLDSLYNEETGEFNIDVPIKKDRKPSAHSVRIPKKYVEALTRQAAERGMTIKEFVSIMIKRIDFTLE